MRLVVHDVTFRHPRGDRDVLKNLSCDIPLGAHMDGANFSEAHVRAMNTIRLMGLASREHESTRILSGGELQRVATPIGAA